MNCSPLFIGKSPVYQNIELLAVPNRFATLAMYASNRAERNIEQNPLRNSTAVLFVRMLFRELAALPRALLVPS